MARPSKSVRVKTGAIASDVEAVRQDVEDKLRGENVPPEPPTDLTDGQREIFQFIVSGLVASDILGQLDIFRVDAQRLVTSGEIGPVDDDAAVKAARTQQCLVENLRPVCRRQDHDALA